MIGGAPLAQQSMQNTAQFILIQAAAESPAIGDGNHTGFL
jgi:hypothetical protein